MIKRLASLLAGAALLAGTPALSQTRAAPAPKTVDADPALWVVKDADTTIYLFGTIHVLKPGLTWFDAGVKKAFDSSDSLVLELVQPDTATMQGLVAKVGYTMTGPTLTEKLPEPDRTAYTKTVTDLGIPPAALDRAKPWLAAVTLSVLPLMKLGYDPNNGPETVLSAAAKSAHKPVTGLETAEQQLGYFDGLPEAAQIKFLESTVKDVPDTGKDIGEMVDEWAKGDPAALAKTMNGSIKDSPLVAKVLLTDRNMRWADWIDARMKQPGTVFIAVGAGHLAGANSVQNQLAKHHLKAVRVNY